MHGWYGHDAGPTCACALHTDSLFPAALAAVFSSCAATVEPSLLRGTAQRHRNGPAWASNDALSKALARTRVPQHLAPRTPDYWAPTHTFVESGHERFSGELKRRYGTFPCRQIRNIWTLFDGLGPCFGLVQITGSILLRYVLKLIPLRQIR